MSNCNTTRAKKSARKIPAGYKLVPPDGNYAWIIAIATFVINMINVTTITSFGVLLNDIITLYDTTTATASWIPSIIISTGQFLGPLHAITVNTIGARKSAIIAGIISSFGLITSYFINRIEILCLTYGIIVGFGFGLSTISINVILGQYFQKNYGIAFGFLSASFGMSRLFIIPTTQYLLDEYGCRGVFLILGAIMLNVSGAASLLQPVKRHLVLVPIEVESKQLLTAESETDNGDVFVKETCSKRCKIGVTVALPANNDHETKSVPPIQVEVSHSNTFGSVSDVCVVRENAATDDDTKDEVKLNNCYFSSWCYTKFCTKIDFTLFREPCFYIVCGSRFLILVLMVFGNTYLYPLGVEKKLSPLELTSITSAKAISDVISALAGPQIARRLNLSVRRFYIGIGLTNVFVLAAVVYIGNYAKIIAWVIASGITFGAMQSLSGILLVETMGAQRLSSVIGLSTFFQGFCMIPMASILGWIHDTTGSFVNTYLVLASLQFVLISLWIIKPYLPQKPPQNTF